MTLTNGSLFSGVAGLELGIASATGAETKWICERDKDASIVLAERFSGVPNLNDITAVDWSQVEPVDIISGGFPCQPFSTAGRRQGVSDDRWMWPQFAECIRHLRPRFVMVENVAAIIASAGAFGRVLGDLAEIGYDSTWSCLRASEVGAPHRRKRLFLVATDTGGERRKWRTSLEGNRRRPSERSEASGHAGDSGAPWHPATDAVRGGGKPVNGEWTTESGGGPSGRPRNGDRSPANTDQPGPQGTQPAERRDVPAGGGWRNWGAYEPAIRRWEAVHGLAPDPVDERGRLSPAFVEWMMGFPPGWVTDAPITRSAQLRCLGNAVVPHVGAAAWQLLAEASATVETP